MESSERPLRCVSAASLFDGHDAAINMIRRLLQSKGAEVIHLGHNRSVSDIVRAAIEEDADAIAVSSYQGGHNEYFTFMVDMLRELGALHIRVIVGGGGTIAADEIAALERYGVEKIYTPEDGRRLGLVGMIDDVFVRIRSREKPAYRSGAIDASDHQQLGRAFSVLEAAEDTSAGAAELKSAIAARIEATPVIGITGTGGAGKSSLTDELLQRFVLRFPGRTIGVIAMDPTRRRSGGALLGDRIRMNSLSHPQIFMRSVATRRRHSATSAVLSDGIDLYRAAGFDLIVVETAGTGQSDTEIVDLVDVSLYVMTSEYGAPSQLEKIDMLDYADLIALNKFEKRGAQDALRDIRKQWRRNRGGSVLPDADIPVFPTIASRFNDAGINQLFAALCARLDATKVGQCRWSLDERGVSGSNAEALVLTERVAIGAALIPAARSQYLGDIAQSGRASRATIERQVDAARRAYAHFRSLQALGDAALPAPLDRYSRRAEAGAPADGTLDALRHAYERALDDVGPEALAVLQEWPSRVQGVTQERYSYRVRGKAITGENYSATLSGQPIPKIAVPRTQDWGEILEFLLTENLPGAYPYTAGVYPYRREAEDPTRMFAGEGPPERTNRRFHYLAQGSPATRLSTAFDSTTLYGEDPDTRPDIYGRTGNSGVSIATLDDMKKLYSGFDLCATTTSVSMTINGPAPMILAMYMNTAIDQHVERYLRQDGRWAAAEQKIAKLHRAMLAAGADIPAYKGELPQGHDGSGLALLGISGDQLVDPATYDRLRAAAFAAVRGTVQADILKEDQAQNTCIFSTEFALRLMGDVQQHFIQHAVRNFYSVSVSGYHIAEAGANPVTQLAFTLANGFTILEYYLARGMSIDDFAPNLSFFFSNGMDPEYAVIGRVARRIWARAMRDRYGGGARSQMLKYHIQTSGRSLHAQEIQFNDIRTTLQALYALFDNCNSLHTNAYDEALTTPTEESVRRAVAIQLIINRELGLNKNQNPWQGSFLISNLTDLVEEAVYREFEALSERGGVLGAMETMYQRGRIQEESLMYETRKHDGSLPLIGVNTFLADRDTADAFKPAPLIRSTDEEKQDQVAAVRGFHARHTDESSDALLRLQAIAAAGGNVFTELLETVKFCSLGQISAALYQVGGRYRRNV